jgi:multidrug efflux pump subunit AcrB
VRRLQDSITARGFPGARVGVRPPRIRGLRTSSSGSDLSIAINGDDLGELQRLSREVARRVRGVPGLENLEASTEEASPTLAIRLDRERAGALGLDVAQVGQTLRTALDGTVATRFAEGTASSTCASRCRASASPAPRTWAAWRCSPAWRGARR